MISLFLSIFKKLAPYLLILFMLSIVTLIDKILEISKKNNQKGINILFTLAFLFPTLMLAFRGFGVGADTGTYIRNFEFISYQSWENVFLIDKDAGYYIFVKILTMITDKPQMLIIVTSIFIGISYMNFFEKNTKYWLLSTLAYLSFGLFAFNMTGIRQSIAMAICVASIEMIKEKKVVKFILIVTFASFFHLSALFFLVSYPIGLLKTNKKNLVVFIIASFVAIIAIELINTLITSKIPQYSNYASLESTGNGFVFFLIVSVISILTTIQTKKITNYNSDLNILINLNYICWLLWAMRLVNRTAERPSMYFIPATIVLMCESISSINDKKTKQYVYLSATIFTIMLFLYRFINIKYSTFI